MEKINDETDIEISVAGETYKEVARRIGESKHKWYFSHLYGMKGEKIQTIRRDDANRIEKNIEEGMEKLKEIFDNPIICKNEMIKSWLRFIDKESRQQF